MGRDDTLAGRIQDSEGKTIEKGNCPQVGNLLEIADSLTFAGLTVAEYLGILWPGVPRRHLQDLFARGRVQSGGKPVGQRRRLEELTDLAVLGGEPRTRAIPLPRGDCGVRVIYENARLIVIAKPSGVPVAPYAGGGTDSCLGFLVRRELQARAQKSPEEYVRPRLVHRVDRLTSGLLLVAKTPAAERDLAECFERRWLRKEYLALVHGPVAAACVTVNCPVGQGRKGRMRAQGRGRAAVTEFDVLERFRHATFLLARPRSGRRHQIRVHAYAMGHPILEDPLYQTRRFLPLPTGLERLALHAWRYTLPPSWPPPRVFSCPLPEDFQGALEELRRGG